LGVNLNNTVRLPDPENTGGVSKHSAQLSFTGTELCRFAVSICRNAIFLFKKWGKIGEEVIRFFIPNKLDFTFWVPNHCPKVYQNRIKVAAVGVFTDRLTE